MYKLLSKIISILIFTSTFAFAEILNKVNIEGNKRISSETIIVLGNIQINSDYDENKINKVLKNLNDSNFFSDIKIDFKNGILQ